MIEKTYQSYVLTDEIVLELALNEGMFILNKLAQLSKEVPLSLSMKGLIQIRSE
jgi:hypothetical protein